MDSSENPPRLSLLQECVHGLHKVRLLGILRLLGGREQGDEAVSIDFGGGDEGTDDGLRQPLQKPRARPGDSGSDTREWQHLTALIEDALREEYEASDRIAEYQDDDSDYPTLPVGAEVIPSPGSKDWREMTPEGSPAHRDAQANPQTPEQFQETLDVMSELRPPLAGYSD